jgi:hypothetical protein
MSVVTLGQSESGVSQRARGAQLVVVGSVVDVASRFERNQWGDQLIVSTAAVEVEETLKGPATSIVRVTFEGGTVGDLTLRVSDMTSLERGNRAVLFLDAGKSGFVPHGRGTDVFLVLDQRGRAREGGLQLDEIRRAVRAGGR